MKDVDQDGLLKRVLAFGEDEVTAAFDELDERYVHGDGAFACAVLVPFRDLTKAMNARDWDGFASLLHDDLVVADHRPVRQARLYAPDWMDTIRSVVNVVPSLFGTVVRYHALEHDRFWAEIQDQSGPNDRGIHVASQSVGLIRDGQFAHLEIFAVNKIEAACSAYAALKRFDRG